MKTWNDDITPFEANRMSTDEFETHVEACLLKLHDVGIDPKDAYNMVDALLNIGYIWGKRVEKEKF